MEERRKLVFHERETRFSEWCDKEGIKRFLFDLDDTICPTREVFRSIMSQAYGYLVDKAPTLSREEWQEEIETINNRLFEKLGVRSSRWDYVVDELDEKHTLGEGVVDEVKEIFQQIYTTPIPMFEGAEEGLGFIKNVGVPIGIVTHAGEEWTAKKYEWLDLGRFVDWESIYIVDEEGHKTSESWMQAIAHFGLEVGNCAVVGDSPRSDINPVWELGVKHCFLVNDSKQWTVHNQPVDNTVMRIDHLNQIPDVVFENC